MAHKYTLGSGATTTDRLAIGRNAAVQLSDGTFVAIYSDNSDNVYLGYTVDRVTWNVISQITADSGLTTGFWSGVGDGGGFALCRDSSDNIYVCGLTLAASFLCPSVQMFAKGVGYSWTQKTVTYQQGYNVTNPTVIDAVWVNSGGGTNGAGHLVMNIDTRTNIGGINHYSTGAYILDAGLCPTGDNQASFDTGNRLGDGTKATRGMGLACDGFGNATILWMVNDKVSKSGPVKLVISSSGTDTGGSSGIPINQDTFVLGTRGRIIRTASNVWCLLSPVASGKIGIARYSATARLTAITAYGAPANFPTPGAGDSWDAGYDSSTSKIWLYGWHTGTPTTMLRLGAAISAGVTWDGAATSDDTAVGTGTNSTIRAVALPVGGAIDWQTHNVNGATRALLGDYTGIAMAPLAPTLLTPATGTGQDLAAGFTFTWTYNPATVGATQTGFQIRRKIGAGAYEYYTTATGLWGASPVTNTLTVGTYTFAAAKWSSGNTYAWSIATVDAGGTGPFASDFTVICQVAPSVSVTAPSGVQQTTNSPTVSWTPTLAGSSVQTDWRVVIYSSAQYGAGGFSPGTGSSMYDSGTVSGAAVTLALAGLVSLPNNDSYRAYVLIHQTGSQASAWAFSAFSEAVDLPAQPTLTAVESTVTGRVTLTAQARDNFLTTNQASLETDTTGWAAGANTTIAKSSTQFLDGGSSLRLTATAGGDVSATTPTGASGTACLPSTQMQFQASFRAGTTTRSAKFTVFWYKAGGAASTVRASDVSNTLSATNAGWVQPFLSVVSPSDAVTFAIVPTVLAAGAAEVFYVDCIDGGPGTSSVWTRGGLVGTTTALFEYSDDSGVTWTTVRSSGAVAVPSDTQIAVAYDYELAPLATRQYRVSIVAPSLAGPVSASASVVSALAQFWLNDVTTPANNMQIDVILGGLTTRQTEQSTAHQPLGRQNDVVIADSSMGGEDGQVVVRTLTAAAYTSLRALVQAQRVLLLKSPFGYQWYVRLVNDRQTSFLQEAWPAATTGHFRATTLAYVQVDKP